MTKRATPTAATTPGTPKGAQAGTSASVPKQKTQSPQLANDELDIDAWDVDPATVFSRLTAQPKGPLRE
jgi:hypothetical protein